LSTCNIRHTNASIKYWEVTPPDGPMVIEEQLRKEREAYDALVKEDGWPSHPVDLGFDVLDNPGKYKDIISY
jgi:hypothetical protein